MSVLLLYNLQTQITPASSKWVQSLFPHEFLKQELMFSSEPLHLTSSSQIGSTPCPYPALNTAIAPSGLRPS